MNQSFLFKLHQQPESLGLRCDESGLFLGGEALLECDGEGRFWSRPAADLRNLLNRIYGDNGNWASRIRSVSLVANAMNNGDMARATMTAVLMRLPEPNGPVLITDVDGLLGKAGFNPDEPRDERGRWTNQDNSSSESSTETRDPRIQLADVGMSDASDDPVAEAAAHAAEAARQRQGGVFPIVSQVAEHNNPTVVVAAADEDERDPRFGIGGNNPPEELIPERLQHSPAGPAVEFLDNLLDITGPGDEANLEATRILQHNLLQAIRRIDPSYVDQALEPQGGLAALSWQGRLNVTNSLRADLAAAIYRVRGEIKPLQEVTLDFLQRATNVAYDEAVRLHESGKLDVRLSREEAIGNYVDNTVRTRLGLFFNSLRVPTDSGSVIRVNRRAYDSSSSRRSYRVPDVRVGNLAFDISLTAKSLSKPQVRGFFDADFRPIGVVIVRPNQLANYSSYVIWRPQGD